MLQILIGTVGFGVLLVVAVAWGLMRGMRALEDDDAGSPDLRAHTARRPVADHRLGWQDQRHLSTVQSDLARRLADRRREAADAHVFRAATSLREPLGHRGPDAA